MFRIGCEPLWGIPNLLDEFGFQGLDELNDRSRHAFCENNPGFHHHQDWWLNVGRLLARQTMYHGPPFAILEARNFQGYLSTVCGSRCR